MTMESQRRLNNRVVQKANLQALGYKVTGLRKVRSKLLVEALIEGIAENGNHKIKVEAGHQDTMVAFYYRGTAICDYLVKAKQFSEVNSIYGDTVSTQNQRKIAREAVSEVFGVMLDG